MSRWRFQIRHALGGEAGEEALLRLSDGGFAIVFSDGGTVGDIPGVALVPEVER